MSNLTRSALDDTARVAAMRVPLPPSGLRGRLAFIAEPYVLFPALAVLVLAVIWTVTINLIRSERATAEDAASVATLDLLNTYEAQVVRALREIDQGLKITRYAQRNRDAQGVLDELRERALLPPDLLFVVAILDAQGRVVASTRPDGMPSAPSEGYLPMLQQADTLWVYRPQRNTASDEWTLQFGRRIEAADGSISGAVIVAVDPAYFVSGYDDGGLGKDGMLGLLGTDGVFRVRRTGEQIAAGDRVDYTTAVPDDGSGTGSVALRGNAWDGVRRYSGAQQLYEYPLAVMVGLSRNERMAATDASVRSYLWRATGGSAAMILLAALLGRMSWQIALGRQRENDAKLAYAQRVEYLAYHDGLTALPNRSLFNKLLSQSISMAQRHGTRMAVAFIDLDRFKQINDTLGHEAGDVLLKEVAVRLKACLRDSDIVARLGGDEFVVLLTDLGEEHYAATVAGKIITTIGKPFMLIGQEFRVTASIGIATYPQDGRDEQTLTKNADIAMYQAKEEGRNNFQFYSEKLNTNTLERLTLESALRHALERKEFGLAYQAKRDINSGQITGMEALLRWNHPDLGVVPPRQFLPVAEETGLIISIGKWVLDTACRQNVEWQQRGLPKLRMAVNLSTRQFLDEDLLPLIENVLKTSSMDPGLLELEIHESLLVHDVARTLRILTALKAMGIKIAIDDFGTGYSSLTSLQQFPLDTIKIDRSYIRDISTRSEDSNLTDAIIAIGKSLSVTVVAQGVETREQANFLRQHACDELQGFYLNRPVSAQQFEMLLRTKWSEQTDSSDTVRLQSG